ncbi:hypothetical protein SAMN02910339_01364 [Lachnospiraceae bacterium YSD2013]|nr:hypothetical protein SAMN02910339_01364 [Lachnospiraceae bacterium YSD2013]
MKYDDVVKRAKNEIGNRLQFGNRRVEYSPCDIWLNGTEINLWTYWQGWRLKDIDEKGVDILVVGQDWGCPSKNPRTMECIQKMQAGDKGVLYPSESRTDKTMQKMFKAFGEGINISCANPGMRLFFTNYSLGYRADGCSESGGMTKKLLREDSELFDCLVEALNPKIIICLGKLTFEVATGVVVKDFVKKLQIGNPCKAPFPKKPCVMVYGVAHCGARGVNNVGGEENMRKAWDIIAKEYHEMFV